jgi:hypothetical protein
MVLARLFFPPLVSFSCFSATWIKSYSTSICKCILFTGNFHAGESTSYRTMSIIPHSPLQLLDRPWLFQMPYLGSYIYHHTIHKARHTFSWFVYISKYLQSTIPNFHPVVPKLLWICTQVKVEVINNKITRVRVKGTGIKSTKYP